MVPGHVPNLSYAAGRVASGLIVASHRDAQLRPDALHFNVRLDVLTDHRRRVAARSWCVALRVLGCFRLTGDKIRTRCIVRHPVTCHAN
jgi:hypothetical protein